MTPPVAEMGASGCTGAWVFLEIGTTVSRIQWFVTQPGIGRKVLASECSQIEWHTIYDGRGFVMQIGATCDVDVG